MTLMAGWCMDALLYTSLDKPKLADKLHKQCKSKICTCKCHNRKKDK